MRRIRLGYIPLTDAAVLIAAKELGFAEREGLDLELVREASWAAVRDRLLVGQIDGAHMLAPLAVACILGLDAVGVPLEIPFVLSINGNAVVISERLHAETAGDDDDAATLGGVLRARAERGDPAVFATVHRFSWQNLQLRRFLKRQGVEPDREVRIVVQPPPYMVEAIAEGAVDGFCVGSPWSSAVVARGLGRIAAFGSDLVDACPEKVLAVRSRFFEAEPDACDALMRALEAATTWCREADHRNDLARILGAPTYLDLDVGLLLPALEGAVPIAMDGPKRRHPAFLAFGCRTKGTASIVDRIVPAFAEVLPDAAMRGRIQT